MKIVKNKTPKLPYYNNLPMYCFGGNATSVEIEKIDSVFLQYWYPNTENAIPCLMIKLKDGTNVSVDYNTEEEAMEVLNLYKRHCLIKVVPNEQ